MSERVWDITLLTASLEAAERRGPGVVHEVHPVITGWKKLGVQVLAGAFLGGAAAAIYWVGRKDGANSALKALLERRNHIVRSATRAGQLDWLEVRAALAALDGQITFLAEELGQEVEF